MNKIAALIARAAQPEFAARQHALADIPDHLAAQSRPVSGENPEGGGRQAEDRGELFTEQFTLPFMVTVRGKRRDAVRFLHRQRLRVAIDRRAGKEQEPAGGSLAPEHFEHLESQQRIVAKIRGGIVHGKRHGGASGTMHKHVGTRGAQQLAQGGRRKAHPMVKGAGGRLRIFRRGIVNADHPPAFPGKLARGVAAQKSGDAGNKHALHCGTSTRGSECRMAASSWGEAKVSRPFSSRVSRNCEAV